MAESLTEIDEFVAGFGRFRERYFSGDESVYARLKAGQNPGALVICCCDSRVDPGLLLSAGPGEIFVVRNVANLVPPYRNGVEMPGIRADIEFAVKGLNVRRIVVLGHSSCGGIRALLDGEGVTEHRFEFIGAWVTIAEPVRARVLSELGGRPAEEQTRACEQWAIEHSLGNLMTFPWIRERVQAGAMTLHGWYFDMETGELLGYRPEQRSFAPLTAATGAVDEDVARPAMGAARAETAALEGSED